MRAQLDGEGRNVAIAIASYRRRETIALRECDRCSVAPTSASPGGSIGLTRASTPMVLARSDSLAIGKIAARAGPGRARFRLWVSSSRESAVCLAANDVVGMALAVAMRSAMLNLPSSVDVYVLDSGWHSRSQTAAWVSRYIAARSRYWLGTVRHDLRANMTLS